MTPGEPLPVPSVPNLRDLGGWQTKSGAVRHGLLFRSTELTNLTDADLPAFQSLGVVTVFDLRTAGERQSQPDRVIPGVNEVIADVFADAMSVAPAQLEQLVSDPKAASKVLGGGQVVQEFAQAYRQLVTLPSAHAAYATLFTRFLNDDSRPALFHCTTGKDRTGWAAASVLTLLGASADDVMAEYLLTNDQLLPALQGLFDKFQSEGGDPALLRPVLGVEPEYLTTALKEMTDQFGTIENYFAKALGIDSTGQQRIRDLLVG